MELPPYKDRRPGKGYLYVTLLDGQRRRNAAVHVLVLEAWRGPKPGRGYEGCHDNGVRTDNRLDNLSWGTRRQNRADRERHRQPRAVTRPAPETPVASQGRRFPRMARSLVAVTPRFTGHGFSGTGSVPFPLPPPFHFLPLSHHFVHSVHSVITGGHPDVCPPAPARARGAVRCSPAWSQHAGRRLDKEGSHALLWRWLSAPRLIKQGGHQPRLDPPRQQGADGDRLRAPPLALDPPAARRLADPVDGRGAAHRHRAAGLLPPHRAVPRRVRRSPAAGTVPGAVCWAREYGHRRNHVKPLHVRLHRHRRDPAGDAPRVVAGNPPRPVVRAGHVAEERRAAEGGGPQG